MLVFKCPECKEEYDVSECNIDAEDDGGNRKILECRSCGAKLKSGGEKDTGKQSSLSKFVEDARQTKLFALKEQVVSCPIDDFSEYVFTSTPACADFEMKDGFTYSSSSEAPEICGNCKHFSKNLVGDVSANCL